MRAYIPVSIELFNLFQYVVLVCDGLFTVAHDTTDLSCAYRHLSLSPLRTFAVPNLFSCNHAIIFPTASPYSLSCHLQTSRYMMGGKLPGFLISRLFFIRSKVCFKSLVSWTFPGLLLLLLRSG